MTKSRAKKLRPGAQVEAPTSYKKDAASHRGLVTARTEDTFTVRWETNVSWPSRFHFDLPAQFKNMLVIAEPK